jgi:hypothetical protein
MDGGDYVYIDLSAITSPVFIEHTKQGLNWYYEGMTKGGKIFFLTIELEKERELSSQISYKFREYKLSPNDIQSSQTVRLEGTLHSFATADIEKLASNYDMTTDTFTAKYGHYYFVDGEVPPDDRVISLVIISIILLLAATITLVRYQRNKNAYLSSVERLKSLGLNGQVETEFDMQSASYFPSAKLLFSEHYVYLGSGTRAGMNFNGRILAYSDIYWLYLFHTSTTTANTISILFAGLADGKKLPLLDRSITADLLDFVQKTIRFYNPNVLIGYSEEIKGIYLSRVKEYFPTQSQEQ